ncbi:TetR family transcriptional regulator [Nocardia sp. NPDC005366]|uniref:TetR family transcriptional regulator n=1 Tax=Nocardia sp. NPDC005366 TaxID=3156878 RepID=UPI00339E13AC
MSRERDEAISEQIIGVVLELLESDGYDAVQLREVAKRAHMSLATVYKHFATRDALLVAAVRRWMEINTYAAVTPPAASETLYDGVMRLLTYVFEPWEDHPKMLEAYYRTRRGAGGESLDTQGVIAIMPIAIPLFKGADPRYAEDVGVVLANMSYALIGRFVDKNIEITEILPTLERAVFRLTSDNAATAEAARSGVETHEIDPNYSSPFNH